jgi:hypothetical protein
MVHYLIESIFVFTQIELSPKVVKRSKPAHFLISFGSSIYETFIALALISTDT